MRGQIPIKNWYFARIIWYFKYSVSVGWTLGIVDQFCVLFCMVCSKSSSPSQYWLIICKQIIFFRSHGSVRLLKLFSVKIFFSILLNRFRSNPFNLLIIVRCQIPAGSECSCMAFLSILFELKFYYLFECYLM